MQVGAVRRDSSDVPSTRVTPRLAAVLTVLQRPTFCSRWAKKTLIDPVVPVYRVSVVVPGPSELVRRMPGLVGSPWQLVKPLTVWVPGTVIWKPNGMPCSRAVMRVNSLDDEPVCTPAPPPYWLLTA